MDNIL